MARAKTIVRRATARLRRWTEAACLTGLALILAPGCSSFQTICTNDWMKAPWGDPESTQHVSHVLSRWENSVRTTRNSADGGAPLVGIAGRVYLMNEEIAQTVNASGEIVVQMLDMTYAGSNVVPQKIAEWRFDPISLKQLKRKDPIGEGYTLFLPWENYNPAVKKVQIQVCYVPRNGVPHYGDETTVSLQSEQGLPQMMQNNVVPAAHYQPGQPAGKR